MKGNENDTNKTHSLLLHFCTDNLFLYKQVKTACMDGNWRKQKKNEKKQKHKQNKKKKKEQKKKNIKR